MREQLERLVAWAKEHPWLAAAIVGGVILLGYIAYRRSAGGGGGTGELFEPAEPSPGGDVSVPDFGTGSAGGGLFPQTETGAGELSTPLETIPAQPAEQFQFAAPDFSEAFTDFGVGDTSDFASYAIPPASSAIDVPSSALATKAPITAATRAAQTPVQAAIEAQVRAATGRSTGVSRATTSVAASTPIREGVRPVPVKITPAVSAPKSIVSTVVNTIANTIKKITSRPTIGTSAVSSLGRTPRQSTIAKTPAQTLGRSATFTGYIGNVYYRSGYPATPPKTTVTRGGR